VALFGLSPNWGKFGLSFPLVFFPNILGERARGTSGREEPQTQGGDPPWGYPGKPLRKGGASPRIKPGNLRCVLFSSSFSCHLSPSFSPWGVTHARRHNREQTRVTVTQYNEGQSDRHTT